jgi:hypothetical protein
VQVIKALPTNALPPKIRRARRSVGCFRFMVFLESACQVVVATVNDNRLEVTVISSAL